MLRQQFTDVPLIALTATATERVCIDILAQLRLKRCVTFTQTFNRPNLKYTVHSKSKKPLDDMLQLVVASGFVRHGRIASGIIYCFSQKDCESVAAELNKIQARGDTKIFPYLVYIWVSNFVFGVNAGL